MVYFALKKNIRKKENAGENKRDYFIHALFRLSYFYNDRRLQFFQDAYSILARLNKC